MNEHKNDNGTQNRECKRHGKITFLTEKSMSESRRKRGSCMLIGCGDQQKQKQSTRPYADNNAYALSHTTANHHTTTTTTANTNTYTNKNKHTDKQTNKQHQQQQLQQQKEKR